MGKNFDYLMKNMTHNGNVADWLWQIKIFFGEEQAEKFCEHFISAHQILRVNDIRNIIGNYNFSVYSCSEKEQIAFFSIYRPINREEHIIKNLENGFEKAQKLYRNRDIEFSKSIKKLGYSYSTTYANWKEKSNKDTYQKEYVFIIFSEKDNPEEFKNNMIKLAIKYNIKQILITDKIIDKTPKMIIGSKQYNVPNGETIKETKDTTIETVEKYLSEIIGSKVLFKVPYEKNKTIIYYENNKLSNYYSKNKQEKVKNMKPYSYNSTMVRNSLINKFNRENYNIPTSKI